MQPCQIIFFFIGKLFYKHFNDIYNPYDVKDRASPNKNGYNVFKTINDKFYEPKYNKQPSLKRDQYKFDKIHQGYNKFNLIYDKAFARK